ncbi:MAG TPA: hypothetical protein VJM53_08975 [Burkholderiales bacterium]|nr:hypothetical protein [Burkholderiales bacterium]
MEEIVAMERAGHEAPVIIQKMRRTTTRLSMSMAQQQQARELGASAALIQALIRAEDEAHEADRLTAEADRAAEERDRREQALAYWNSYDPYYGPYWPHSYFGYGAGHHHHGWGVGVGSGWGW